MRTLFLLITLTLNLAYGVESLPWSDAYHYSLLEKAGNKVALLSTYPVFRYPNKGSEHLPSQFSNGKVLLFGYGSLMNEASARRNMSEEAVKTMKPVVAFGLKRIFNYTASHTAHWGEDQDPREKAMLNLMPLTTYRPVINGVVFQIDAKDLENLVQRETGYDLVPILVADWNAAKNENTDIAVQIAYTFIVPEEIRCGIAYTQRKYYPVRGYLNAIREGACRFGQDYLDFFEQTTFLSDGTTLVGDWDATTFKGRLCSQEP